MDGFDDVFDNMEELMMAEMLRAENDPVVFDEPPEPEPEPVRRAPGRKNRGAPPDPQEPPQEVINILDLDVREAFIQDVKSVGYSAEWFTKPQVPTVTLDGTSSGILFHEEHLISELEATPRVIMFTCNFGKVIYPGYVPPTPAKKRKKKVARRRKVQGDGSSFNSQISCFVCRLDYTQPWTDADGNVHQPEMTPDGLYYVIPTNAPRFEYKIFRNGRLQLPGATLTTFDEGIAGAKIIQKIVWEAIGNRLVEPIVTSMASVMINFKFQVKLRHRYIIDLKALSMVLMRECKRKTYGVSVNLVKYSRQKPNLSAEIIVDGIPGVTRTNIYLRGRVNIIGVKIPSVASRIFDFLHMIFSMTNEPALTRREGGICYVPMIRNLRAPMDPVKYADLLLSGTDEYTEGYTEGYTAGYGETDPTALVDFLEEAAREQEQEIANYWQELSAALTA